VEFRFKGRRGWVNNIIFNCSIVNKISMTLRKYSVIFSLSKWPQVFIHRLTYIRDILSAEGFEECRKSFQPPSLPPSTLGSEGVEVLQPKLFCTCSSLPA
jgi:hypothetical protein